jgi:hypothetical protein
MTKMVEVTQDDANNYSRILSVLGLEEEGDPVAEVKMLKAFFDNAQRRIEARAVKDKRKPRSNRVASDDVLCAIWQETLKWDKEEFAATRNYEKARRSGDMRVKPLLNMAEASSRAKAGMLIRMMIPMSVIEHNGLMSRPTTKL